MRGRLVELAREKSRFGYRRLQVLLEREGQRVNHKRIYRIYRGAGLCLRRKKRKHCLRVGAPLRQLTAPNQEWALDFVHDAIAAGRAIRVLSVVDVYTRECLALEVEIATYFPVVMTCSALLTILAGAQVHRTEHPWDYGSLKGPSHWGDLKPEYAQCKNGHHQSPIDIRNVRKADLPPIEFAYQPAPLRLVDNRHTIMVNYSPDSFISVGGKRYELKQFHFHRPSEEKINGKRFAMVIHLVHADEKGHLAVVAVLLQQGESNSGATCQRKKTKKKTTTAYRSIQRISCRQTGATILSPDP
jgi:carbonic anhydrase